MNSFSRMVVLLATIMLNCQLANAQSIPSPETMAAQTKLMIEKMEAIKGGMQLTDDQDAKIREILNGNLDKMLAVMKTHNIKPGDKLSFEQKISLSHDLKPIKQESDKKLETFLSSDQMKEFESIRKQTRDAMKADASN